MMKSLFILGIRGVPAQHGGFETFAEKLALYLVSQGWKVTVYCQEDAGERIWESEWQGIHRVHVPVSRAGALGTIYFDFKATLHSIHQDGLFLTLGYNTAIFNLSQRFARKTNVFNMDGIEWRRDKWNLVAKAWFWLNERIGCWVGNHLVADHPKILEHLATRVAERKITMIPYGSEQVLSADPKLLETQRLEPYKYSVIIARPEPENSFLEMIRSFSQKARNHKLVVLGNFTPETNAYHKKVIDCASREVIFVGAIYDTAMVQALRFYCQYYLHGHRVGGTNPSLVEALGAGCAVIAHDNHFNRWVAGSGAAYFQSEADCEKIFDSLLDNEVNLDRMRVASSARHKERFTWEQVLREYEQLLTSWHPPKKS